MINDIQKKYFFILLFSIFLIGYDYSSLLNRNLSLKYKPKNKIFSFWEPKEKIPGYIHLCIQTWKKNLPQYEINILDYKGVKEYIGDNLFNNIISKKMSLRVQADAIRVALLKKFGGIWMDADTVIINGEFLKDLDKYELVMFGKNKGQHIGFIFASKYSIIISEWLNEIINRVNNYRKINSILKNRTKRVTWHYLGNGIINRIINLNKSNKFCRLNKDKMNVFPEITFFRNTTLSPIKRYRLFYFKKGHPKIVLNNVKGIIMLHNSWTPLKYQKMSENKFLKEDILLSRLLSLILNKKL